MKLNLVKNYKTYDRYKDSGVEWLGEIPDSWNAEKIKTKIKKHFSGVWGEEKKEDGNDFLCLRVADFDYPKLSFKNVETTRNIAPKDQHRVLRNQDILIEKSGGGDKQPVGRAIFFNSDNKMFCANFIEVLRLNKEAESKFFAYLFSGLYNVGLNKRSIKQNTGIQNLDLNYFLDEIVPLPPKQTQQKIADYLDEKTETIDKIIKRKKKLIELLEEKRKNTIKDCIKKTNSEKIKLSYLTRIERGRFNHRPRNDPSFYNGIYPFIQTGDIVKSKTKIKKYSQTLNELGKSVSKKFPKGTLLMSIAANIGDVAILDFDAYLPDSIVGFLPSKKIKPKFLFYQFNIMKEDFLSLAVENTQLNLNIERMGIIKITCPSLVKQQEIIDYLDKKTEDIDKTIKKINQSINLLTEYKSSLISNVVTGKAKV
jgi:type I restriction enzyme S subunit